MIRKISLVVAVALFLSGCSVSVPTDLGSTGGSIWKSFDAGKTFVPKVTVNEKQRISTADVVSFVFDPRDAQTLYIGTREHGIFKTSDGAEHWEPLTFPPIKVYGLTIDRNNGDRMYASGVYEDIAKIYRSEDAGNSWKEIYTEPGKGTVITALGSNPGAPETLYAGTSNGVVIKSTNGGETWQNVLTADGPITKILFRSGLPDAVTLLVLGKGVAITTDGGKTWNEYAAQDSTTFDREKGNSGVGGITTITLDPQTQNILYAGGTNGLFKSEDGGKSWRAMSIIESSKTYPVRAIAINPTNSKEIVYASGNAFYRSVDGGIQWATTQLEIDRGVSIIEYEPGNPTNIYFTLRKF